MSVVMRELGEVPCGPNHQPLEEPLTSSAGSRRCIRNRVTEFFKVPTAMFGWILTLIAHLYILEDCGIEAFSTYFCKHAQIILASALVIC